MVADSNYFVKTDCDQKPKKISLPTYWASSCPKF